MCLEGVEDERHFVLSCPLFKKEREEMIMKVMEATGGELKWEELGWVDRMRVLVGEGVQWNRKLAQDCRKAVLQFVERAWKKRNKLMKDCQW